MDLVKKIQKFLEIHWDGQTPFLVGYSGGPDSKALVYALLKAKITSFHLAHVDHGWRKESEAEAASLFDEAKALNIPFHFIRLEERPAGNWEDFGRRARLKFFKSLFETIPFSALLLAHHADDAAETALKRVFEGAHLTNLKGMTSSSCIDGMRIWRPLLSARKQEILAFLQSMGLSAILDATNEDLRFLRGKLRRQVLPFLEQSFGKKIASNLHLLSERSLEIQEYLNRKIEPLWNNRLQGPWGVCLELAAVERIEARHLLQRAAFEEGIVIGRDLLERWLDALEVQKSDVIFEAGGRFFGADRGRAFLLAKKEPRFGGPIVLRDGNFFFGDWTVHISPYRGEGGSRGWKSIWTGRFEVALPHGILQLPSSVEVQTEAARKAGVPSFFRKQIPIVLADTKIFEFMTEKAPTDISMHWFARFFFIQSI